MSPRWFYSWLHSEPYCKQIKWNKHEGGVWDDLLPVWVSKVKVRVSASPEDEGNPSLRSLMISARLHSVHVEILDRTLLHPGNFTTYTPSYTNTLWHAYPPLGNKWAYVRLKHPHGACSTPPTPSPSNVYASTTIISYLLAHLKTTWWYMSFYFLQFVSKVFCVRTYRNARLRHCNAVRVDGGLHTLAEGSSETVRLIFTLAPVPLGASEHRERVGDEVM